ncbi:unnamed protein product, partial [Effrenium voratum]
ADPVDAELRFAPLTCRVSRATKRVDAPQPWIEDPMSVSEERLGTAQSNASRMSDSRRAKLMDLKRREDLKDALVEKFKGRFGKGSSLKDPDEMSVSSDVIRKEV